MTCVLLTNQRATADTPERRHRQLTPCRPLAALLALALLRATPVFAAGVVGTGTPGSCTEAALDEALDGGGDVRFDCGASPVTIGITVQKVVTADTPTDIDGAGLITISGGNPGAVFAVNHGGNLTIQNLTVANGHANGLGGGMANYGTVTVSNCTFSGNNADQGGGAIFNEGTLTLLSSTFFDNRSAGGGALRNDFGGTVTVTNSTFSGNISTYSGNGGAILNNGTLTVTNSTFAGDSGGTIYNSGLGSATVTNTIIASSSSGGSCNGTITDGGHNLDDGTSCGFSAANGSLSNRDPKLDPAGLQDNGGPTDTIALLAGSPAINTGDPEVCADPPVNGIDQRRHMRPGAGSVNCSIGAYEYNASVVATPLPTATATQVGFCGATQGTCTPKPTRTPTATPTITLTPTVTATPTRTFSTVPIVVGNGTPSSCTEAALDAALPGGGTIIFNCGASPTVITITSTKTILSDTTIDGGNRITLSGGNTVTVFSVATSGSFRVQNLTIANGHGGNGGAIVHNHGTLTLTNCTFSENSASGMGGAIVSIGALTVSDTTFSGNTASNGGAIAHYAGTASVSNSTFSGNTAHDGGAIFSSSLPFGGFGTMTVTNCTFAGNSASNGGAVINNYATLTVSNTIFADNTGGTCNGPITDNGHNLDDGTSCGFSAANGSLSNTDPKLDPAGLANNGGPTETIALLPGSPAINAGDPEVCTDQPVNGVDQRSYPRPGWGFVNCSIGAYEFSLPVPTPTATATPTPTPNPTATPQPSGNDGGCTVTPTHSGAASWLLVPALVLAWARRRAPGTEAVSSSERSRG